MVKAKVGKKVRKKIWIPILAPKIFNSRQLGETYLYDAKDALQRTVTHNLKEITDNIKDQSTYLTFRIKNWANNALQTEVISYWIMPSSVKKLIRRGTSRIDYSFKAQTSDGRQVVLKFVIQTAFKAQKAVRSAILKQSTDTLTSEVAKLNFGNLLDKLISHKLQFETRKVVNKIYPIKNFEIRLMELSKDQKPQAEGTPSEPVATQPEPAPVVAEEEESLEA